MKSSQFSQYQSLSNVNHRKLTASFTLLGLTRLNLLKISKHKNLYFFSMGRIGSIVVVMTGVVVGIVEPVVCDVDAVELGLLCP